MLEKKVKTLVLLGFTQFERENEVLDSLVQHVFHIVGSKSLCVDSL